MSRNLWLVGLLISSVVLNLLLMLAVLTGWRPVKSDAGLIASDRKSSDVFQDFEIVGFARDFSERYASFDSETFRATQIATAFLMTENQRAARIEEIDRLAEKMVKRGVVQKAKLLRLTRTSDHFQADLAVELTEGSGSGLRRDRFPSRLRFSVTRVERSAQNPWGFLIQDLEQTVPTELESPKRGAEVALSQGSSALLRFPCVIENVELPKDSPIKVRLTTLDVSELQMRADRLPIAPLAMKAVCRDRVFDIRILPMAASADSQVVLQALTMEESKPAAGAIKSRSRAKTAIEKSIEEQLGFVIEAE